MSTIAPESKEYSFEEYKLYYESAERVTDRRLATNTWNYSICTAIIVSIAALVNWSLVQTNFQLITISLIILLAVMGLLLCTLWSGQIKDFKNLNAAKFEVINTMAPLVRFGSNNNLVSAAPFAHEWTILKEKEATQDVRNMSIVALRSSNAEFLVPKAFRWFFLLITIFAVATLYINWATLRNSTLNFRPLNGSASSNPSISEQPARP